MIDPDQLVPDLATTQHDLSPRQVQLGTAKLLRDIADEIELGSAILKDDLIIDQRWLTPINLDGVETFVKQTSISLCFHQHKPIDEDT